MSFTQGLCLFVFATLSFAQSLTHASTPAATTFCGNPDAAVKKENIHCLVSELIENHFPELQQALQESRIVYRDLNTHAYYFKTWQISGVFSANVQKRTYSIRINSNLFNTAPEAAPYPSILAVQGILAHELFHIVDYEKAKTGGFIKNQLQELLTNKKYERYTDLRALERGFASGLKAYRAWIYTKISGRDLKNKRARYFTPEEIDAFIALNSASSTVE